MNKESKIAKDSEKEPYGTENEKNPVGFKPGENSDKRVERETDGNAQGKALAKPALEQEYEGDKMPPERKIEQPERKVITPTAPQTAPTERNIPDANPGTHNPDSSGK
jgi:hypothetical protein